MLARGSPPSLSVGARSRSSAGPPSSPMSSTGTTTSTSSGLRWPASTIVPGRSRSSSPRPPRNRAISSSGRWVADSPIRCGEVPAISSSRSSERARWAPRLFAASAWISSRITHRTLRRSSRACEVSIRKSDSGVVIRMSGGRLAIARRSFAGVSPEGIAGQPRSCTRVGSGNVPSNQDRTAGENGSRLTAPPYREPVTASLRGARVGFGTMSVGGLFLLGVLAVGGPITDQVVVSGTLTVPRGHDVGEVVVLHGSATVAGVAHGDVVVVDGPIQVTGQVSGSVIAAGGSVRLGPSAQVGEDVIASGRVSAAKGAKVSGTIRDHATFAWRGSVEALGRFASWAAVSFSTLLLAALLLLIVPRRGGAGPRGRRHHPVPNAGRWRPAPGGKHPARRVRRRAVALD